MYINIFIQNILLYITLGNGRKSWRWSNNDNWQYIKELFV